MFLSRSLAEWKISAHFHNRAILSGNRGRGKRFRCTGGRKPVIGGAATLFANRKPRSSTIPTLTVLLIFAGVALPAIFRNAQFTENYDESKYHLPAITQFAAQLPHLDLRKYSSATTPLFHILFALLLRAGRSLTTLRLTNFAISVATVLLVIAYLRNAAADSSRHLPYRAAL